MARENIDDFWQYAKDLAQAERELQIEQWVCISFELTSANGKRVVLHKIDLPRKMLQRWQWVIEWRKAKLICQNPKYGVRIYHSYYDKRTGLETGFNTLLSRLASKKAQVTKVKRAIKEYVEYATYNDLFFNAETDEILKKAQQKLRQKENNVEVMLNEVKRAVIEHQKLKENENH